ncbi:putative beta-lysine N-acetyltransferase [Mariniphaga sediminis]|nr:putative beta-lysine N-acetyltransferase [Mariniphaga sediminis]
MNGITEGKIMEDKIEKIGRSTIQHGKSNNRIYLLKLNPADSQMIVPELDNLAKKEGYTKIVTKIHTEALPHFISAGYIMEAYIPRFYNGNTDCVLASRFLDKKREQSPKGQLQPFFKLFDSVNGSNHLNGLEDYQIRKLNELDAVAVTEVFKQVFETYPFPVHKPEYILKTMQSKSALYYGVWDGDRLIGVSTAETDFENKNAEMTDFAVLPEYRGKQLASHLLALMESDVKAAGIKTAYTIARLSQPGMNKTFMKAAYNYSGTLVNNTNIGGSIESMNIFYKHL